MNCQKCLQPVDDDSKFCRHCGAPVTAMPGEQTPPQTVPSMPGAKSDQADKGPDVHRDPKHEKVVWEGRPAWRSYWGQWLIWLLGSIACIFLSHRWAGGESALFKAVLLLVVGAAVTLLVREALLVFSLRYRLTTQRLFLYRGIITRTTDQMELIRVDDVRLRQGITDRIVNTGDVEIVGTDATDQSMVLEAISEPGRVTELLRLHVRGVRSKGTLLVENV